MRIPERAFRWWYSRQLWILLGLALLVLASFAAVPLVLSWRLEAAIARSLPGRPPVQASIAGRPTALVAGRFERVDIEVRRARAGEMEVNHLTLHLNDVVLDTSKLMVGGEFAFSSVGGGRGVIEFTEENLRRFLVEEKDVRNAVVSFAPNHLTVEADLRVLGADLRVSLDGRLAVSSPTTVDLRVQNLSVGTLSVGSELGNALAASVNPVVRLQGLPVDAQIESVVIEEEVARVMLRVRSR